MKKSERILNINEAAKQDTSSIMPEWHIKETSNGWAVYTKKYAHRGRFDTKSDAYDFIVDNPLHNRGVIHVHEKSGTVIEDLKFPFRKLPIRCSSEHEPDYKGDKNQ